MDTVTVKSGIFEAQYTTDADLLTSLSTHSNSFVREKVAANIHTPAHVIENLTEDESLIVVCKALRNVNVPPKVHDEALRSRNGKIRTNAVRNPITTAHQLRHMVNDPYQFVVLEILEHPNVTSDVLKKFAKSSIGAHRAKAVENPLITAEDLLAFSNDESKNVVYHLIRHPNTSDALLQNFVENFEFARLIAQHNNTGTKLLHIIAETHSRTQNATKMFTTLSLHPNCPQKLLNSLAKHDETSIRSNVSKNISTPTDTLNLLTKDVDDKVKVFAVKNLLKKGEFADWPVEWVEENFGVKL